MSTIRFKTMGRGRRRFLRSGAAALGVGALGVGALGVTLAPSPAAAKTAREIDVGVDVALSELFAIRPETRGLYERSFGVLVIPDILKAGFVVGGAYGEGRLLTASGQDSYWSYSSASIGFQAGAQRTRQALFFMTEDALRRFQQGDSFEFGAEAEVTVIDDGLEVGVDNIRDFRPILVYSFGRQGLLGGVALAGGKYERIRR